MHPSGLSPRPSPTRARLAAAGRVIGLAAWRAAEHLGPLILDALAYLARLAAEAIQIVRLAMLRRARTKAPASAADYDRIESALREKRAARWRTWNALTWSRRAAVRAAAISIVVSVATTARLWWSPSGSAESPDASAQAAAAPVEAGGDPGEASSAPVAPAPDASRIRETFQEEVRTIASGEWAVLWDAAVLDRGSVGAWDDVGVFSPVVLKHEDPETQTSTGAAARYRMWFRGCHVAMYEHTCGIGHAVSADGLMWEKAPQPVFVPADPTQQSLIDEISVVRAEGRYWLWYSLTANYESERRRATIHLATSPDGLVWTDEGQVREGEADTAVRIEHAVHHDGRQFHMWYVTRLPDVSSPVLQHLTSSNGRSWAVAGATRIWDLRRYMEPMGRLLVWPSGDGGFRAIFAYTGSQLGGVLGRLASSDGTTWSLQPVGADPLVNWRRERRTDVHALTGLLESGGLRLWMLLLPRDDGPSAIGAAFRKGDWP